LQAEFSAGYLLPAVGRDQIGLTGPWFVNGGLVFRPD